MSSSLMIFKEACTKKREIYYGGKKFKHDMTYNHCYLLFLNDVLTQDHYFSRSLKHSVPPEKKRKIPISWNSSSPKKKTVFLFLLL